MLIISTFYQGNFQQKALIINIALRLRMSTYASAYASVDTSLNLAQNPLYLLDTVLKKTADVICICSLPVLWIA